MRLVADIAIVGGGPAGATLAAGLAGRGRRVLLLDEKMSWEKPCGGGLTAKALERYPFLRHPGCNLVRECELAGPAGTRVLLPLDRPVAIYARRRLNALLLARARAAGADLRRERVLAAEPVAGGWRLRLHAGEATAARLAIAAGARSRLRARLVEPLPPADLMAAAGYFVPADGLPWPKDRIVIQFLPGLEGYIWSFPRPNHASIGICGPLAGGSTAALRQRLERWLEASGVTGWQSAPFYAHVLPALGPDALRRARFDGVLEGSPWALVGDAAGLVDSITGEGLYYALRSAECLATVWRRDAPSGAYTAAVRVELLPELEAAAAMAARFYGGRFLGAAALDRMVQFTAGSARFRALMCDLFAGAQPYRGLRRRFFRELPVTLVELAAAACRRPAAPRRRGGYGRQSQQDLPA